MTNAWQEYEGYAGVAWQEYEAYAAVRAERDDLAKEVEDLNKDMQMGMQAASNAHDQTGVCPICNDNPEQWAKTNDTLAAEVKRLAGIRKQLTKQVGGLRARIHLCLIGEWKQDTVAMQRMIRDVLTAEMEVDALLEWLGYDQPPPVMAGEASDG